jgi:putative transposase
MAQQEPYPSELTDKEWNILEKLLPPGSVGATAALQRRSSTRFFIWCGGLHLGGLPMIFPYHRVLLLCQVARARGVGKDQSCAARWGAAGQREKKAPSAAIIDSQSVKVAEQPGERGYDAGKKVNGRKRHLLVDTLGLILAVVVHRAAVQDRDGAKLLPALLNFGWVRKVFADGGYAGQLLDWVKGLIPQRGLKIEIVKRIAPGFKILPKRWLVERTFAWLGRYRRLAKDYERKTKHSEATIYIASCKIMLAKLVKSSAPTTF